MALIIMITVLTVSLIALASFVGLFISWKQGEPEITDELFLNVQNIYRQHGGRLY